MKTPKKLNLEMLTPITKSQQKIRHWLLLSALKQTADQAKGYDKQRRKKLFNLDQKSQMPKVLHSNRFMEWEHQTTQWWNDELKWAAKHFGRYNSLINRLLYALPWTNKHFGKNTNSAINSLSYRLLRMFFFNTVCIRFDKKHPQDKEDFDIENQKLFQTFINQSIQIIQKQKKYQPIIKILPLLKKVQLVNISQYINSAGHQLNNTDWDIAKTLLNSGLTIIEAGLFLGPVIGSFIGNLAGLSGAAALKYGLAWLGGGSLASGGFGIAGGRTVVGLSAGGFQIIRGLKNISKDQLNKMQLELAYTWSVLLAIGCVQYENGDKAIPKLIHKKAGQILKESKQRLRELEKYRDSLSDDEYEAKGHNIEEFIQVVKQSITLYERAVDMSKHYDWWSLYDIWQKIKSWAS